MTTETPTLTAVDLESGDTLRDTEGHGKTNPYGPDLTEEIAVVKPWHGDSWLFAPVVENGKVSNKHFAVSYDEIDGRLQSGRYEPVDCEIHRTLDADSLPVSPDEEELMGDDWRERAADLQEHGIPERRAQVVALIEQGRTHSEVADELDMNDRSNVWHIVEKYRTEDLPNAKWLATHGPDV